MTTSPARPLVTIITPCFNHERYLDDYFGGLLAQTYEEVELIVFDDGSTDASWQMIEAYLPAAERKFVRVVGERHENMGSTQELQLALARATGDLLCILESDDYYMPTMLEEIVRYLAEHPEVGVIHADTDYLYPEGIERAHWRNARPDMPVGDVYEDLLVSNFAMNCAMCVRMELFRAHVDLERHIRLGYALGDWASCLALARHTRFGYIDKPLARYRIVEGSVTHPTRVDAWARLSESALRMRSDHADDPRVSAPVAEQIRRDYHRYLYRLGLALGRPADCRNGYSWLRARYPDKYGKIRHRLAVRLVALPALWRIADRLGVITGLWRTWNAVRTRQAWRARQPYVEPGPTSRFG